MSLSERAQALIAARRAEREKQERIIEEERQRYAREKELFDALPMPIGLEDIKEEDLRPPHRYEKYIEAVLAKIADDLQCRQGYRDDTTFKAAFDLIELAAAEWNDLTFQQAYEHLRKHAPSNENPRGGPKDLPRNFVQLKWRSAEKSWHAKGSMPRPKPPQDLYQAPVPVNPRIASRIGGNSVSASQRAAAWRERLDRRR
jgi:hypothetical protein